MLPLSFSSKMFAQSTIFLKNAQNIAYFSFNIVKMRVAIVGKGVV